MAPLPLPALRSALIALAMLNAVSAVGGLVGLVFLDGLGMPAEYAEPFPSFAVPGLVLGFVVGGTQTWSALTLARWSPRAPLATAVAGFGLQLWIFVELALITEFMWLQVAYFAAGTAQVALALAMLGVAPGAVTRTWAERRRDPSGPG